MDSTATTPWFQIVLSDQNILKGEKVIKVMDLLLAVVPAELAVLLDPEWSGYEADELKGKSGEAVIVPPKELARRIGNFVRFNWGTVFFTTHNRQRSTPIILKESNATSLAKSLFAIRFVDSHLLFAYTPDIRQCEILTNHFLAAEAKKVPISDLVFPY